ncbi:ATP-binding cassette domain-containing protein [Streptomyces virginiae]|uniref:ATP-binding cassette domain-containing protein n=1 Tax=Streptomyces virginiae TaxID=1961 RepID=UPI002B1E04B7|nr:ATP-binding cassette domain-containing protein [Streptomyces virginiae]
MIEVKELTGTHGGRIAVHRQSLTARPGAVTAFLGASGAGKTGTLRLILELDTRRPTLEEVLGELCAGSRSVSARSEPDGGR